MEEPARTIAHLAATATITAAASSVAGALPNPTVATRTETGRDARFARILEQSE